MGTDIHIGTEVRVDGIWSHYPAFPRWGEDGFDHDNDPSERFYKLFALLADVRNGFGFAGVVTHAPITPLFPGRGLPDDRDVSAYNEDDEDAPWLGDHSFTWADFYQLKEIVWDDHWVVSSGYVTADKAILLADGEQPEEWSGGVSGGNTRMFTCLQDWENSGRPEKDSYIECFWHSNPFVECAFRRWVDGRLTEIADEFGPANVRVLMGFDS